MRRFSSFVLTALWLVCARAMAEERPALPLELTWQAPGVCPTASDVHAELARIASAAPGEDLRPLRAEVAVTETGGRFAARLRTEHEGLGGERTLQADDCATLTRSVTLVLALAFGRSVELRSDPTAGSDAPANTEPAATPAATPGPKPEASEPEPVAPEEKADAGATGEPEDAASSSVRLGFLLGGGGQLTLLPAIAPSFSAGARVELASLALELRASGSPGVSQSLDTGTSARAVFDALAATALACTQLSLADLCAGGRAAAIRSRARGLFESGERTAPWYALAVAAGLTWPKHGAVRLSLEALLALSMTRPRFEVTGLGAAHRVPLLAPELSLFLRLWP